MRGDACVCACCAVKRAACMKGAMSQAVGVGSATCDTALPLLAPAPFSGASCIHSPRLFYIPLSLFFTLSPSLSLSPSAAAEPVRWLKRASLLESRPCSGTRVWMRGATFPSADPATCLRLCGGCVRLYVLSIAFLISSRAYIPPLMKRLPSSSTRPTDRLQTI